MCYLIPWKRGNPAILSDFTIRLRKFLCLIRDKQHVRSAKMQWNYDENTFPTAYLYTKKAKWYICVDKIYFFLI